MAASRPLVNVYSLDGEVAEQVNLPAVFTAPIRPDIVNFVHAHMLLNSRHPYSVSALAGKQTSAESWGTGRAVSRIPRVPGGGTHRAGQGAFGNMCRGGRMFAPTKPWRKWQRKTNRNLRRFAVVSAIAASAVPSLVMARGHKIGSVPEIPLVVDDGVEGMTKTKDAAALLRKLGAGEDVEKARRSRQVRTGKGKLRNRRHVVRKGPLVVYGNDGGVVRAFRNIPGVDFRCVDRLHLRQLAPGSQVGRFVIWTKSAFEKLDEVFGTQDTESLLKKGYKLPRSIVGTADISRIIQSDEVQNIVRPPKVAAEVNRVSIRKANPLKNRRAMYKLNPYAVVKKDRTTRTSMKLAQRWKEIKEARAKKVEDGKKLRTKGKKSKIAKVGKAYYRMMIRDSEYQGESYEQFTRWLGLTQ
eukprot:evm.model.scf_672.4 EVM.evm.TU.scf_672.4   scf_672:18501-20649(+)